MEEATTIKPSKGGVLKKVYLYLVSLISLVMLITASVMILNIALKAWVFKQADNNSYNYACPMTVQSGQPVNCNTASMIEQQHEQVVSQRETDAAKAIALIIVAAPVFWYHWKLVRRET